MDYLSADIRRHVAAEESGDVGNVFGRAAAAKRNGGDPALSDRLRKRIGHVGDDESRSDAIGPDAARAHLLGDGLRQTDKTGLRGGVVALAGIAGNTDDAAHVDNAPAALTGHHGSHGVYEIECRLEIDVQHRIPLLFAHAEHQAVPGYAGVIDQNIDAPERGKHLSNNAVGGFERRSVRGIGLYFMAEGRDLGG